VAAKDLRYLVREPRRLVAVLTTSLLPVLVVVGPALGNGRGFGSAVVFTVCGVGLLAGARMSNRFGVDGSATWILLGSAGDERDVRRDLVGGDLAVGLVVGPAVVLIGVGLAAIVDGWAYLPAALGLALVLLTMGGLLAGGAVCLPLLALLVPAPISSSAVWGAVLLVVGPAYGLAVGALIRRYAARLWAQRATEVLQVVSAAVGGLASRTVTDAAADRAVHPFTIDVPQAQLDDQNVVFT